MNRFERLVEIHTTFLNFEAAKSVTEYGILIHIGLNEQTGYPLTLKQLLSLQIGPKSTVERIIGDLAKSGKILKVVSPTDKRNQLLCLSEETKLIFFKFHDTIQAIMK